MKHFIGAASRMAFDRLSAVIDRRWNENPFGKSPRAPKAEYLRLFEETRRVAFPEIDKLEAETGFAISGEWIDDLALHTQITIKKSPLAYPHGRVLYSLLRRYLAENPSPFVTIVETGTARGFSALCMAKALEDADVAGHILTLDVLPHHRSFFWNCIDDHEGKKTRAELLQPWRSLLDKVVFLQGDTLFQLPRLGVDRIHFAFIDAQHTKKDVMKEYQCVSRLQAMGDMIVFDDVTPGTFDGVVAAVDAIEQAGDYAIQRLTASKTRSYAWGSKQAR